MVAFWEDILYRDTQNSVGKPGASMHFPKPRTEPRNYTWPDFFSIPISVEQNSHVATVTSPNEIVDVKSIWADVDPRVNDMRDSSVRTLTCLPSYDTCFQGF